MLRADLHIHSCYSPDCRSSLEDIVARCQERGINCIAIADHGTVEGALKLHDMAPFKVLIAEEVRTPWGEVMGLFLEETIPNNIPLGEAIARIRKQGGLVGIPHPFVRFGRSALGGDHLEALVPDIDFVEVFNARNILFRDSERARRFAERYGLPGSASSDAHTLAEIGNAYVEMPEFETKEEFLSALGQGCIYGKRTGPLAHLSSLGLWLRRAFGG